MKRLIQRFYVAGAATLMTTPALAQTGLNRFFGHIGGQLSAIPAFFSTACYVVGIGMVIAGLFKLKEYVDDPSSGALQDALIRLVLGGLLILLPFAVEIATESAASNDGTVELRDTGWQGLPQQS